MPKFSRKTRYGKRDPSAINQIPEVVEEEGCEKEVGMSPLANRKNNKDDDDGICIEMIDDCAKEEEDAEDTNQGTVTSPPPTDDDLFSLDKQKTDTSKHQPGSSTSHTNTSYPPAPKNITIRKPFYSFIQVWLVACLNYVYQYARQLSERLQLQAELNKTKAKQVDDSAEDEHEETAIEMMTDHDCSYSSSGRESGYYSSEHISPSKDHSINSAFGSSISFDTSSPRSLAQFDTRQLWTPLAEEPFQPKARSTPLIAVKDADRPRAGPKIERGTAASEAASKQRRSARLPGEVSETKYVTAIFEAPKQGIETLVDDVLLEFQTWFDKHDLLGIATEVHWSVPQSKRNRLEEMRLKNGIHASLRYNNRRAMDAMNVNSSSLADRYSLPESTTQENARQRTKLDCFQGVYRRYYDGFLDNQHTQTESWHEPYWKLNPTCEPPEPNPEQFLLGKQPTRLNQGSLIAVNLIGLKLKKPVPRPKVQKMTISVRMSAPANKVKESMV